MSRATLGLSRYHPRRQPRPALRLRARALGRAIAATPPLSRAANGAWQVSLPVAAVITAAVCTYAVVLVEIASIVLTGGRL